MKRVKLEKEKNFLNRINFNLAWGTKGLKVSFFILLIIIILIAGFMIINKNLSEAGSAFKMPDGSDDYLMIFAGFLLFVAVPFLIGIRIGLRMRRR